MSVAERVRSARHGRVRALAVEHLIDRGNDRCDVGADEPRHARLDRLETLAGVAHDQNRLAQRRGFFLHAA